MRNDPASQHLAQLGAVPNTQWIGRRVEWSASTGSTNDDLKALARTGAAEGLVLLTDEQTAGRGRRGRHWAGPAATSLLQSILIRPTWLPASDGFLLTMLVAVAAAEAIEQAATVPVALKWPNDLEHSGRKLGGILVEAEVRDHMIQWAVLGIGLNVNWDPTILPAIADRATSLAAVRGGPVDRVLLFITLMQRLDYWYAQVRQGARTTLLASWTQRLTTIGRTVQADTPHGPLLGVAEGVDAQGALLIRTPDGHQHTLHAGEVSVRHESSSQ